jgi:hypothetical protein
MTAPRLTVRLQRALIRLLWDSVADNAECTCAPKDRCPQCDAMLALGLGRWKGPISAQRKLIEKGARIGGRTT